MRLIERRIGLLFGAFLLCFLLIVGRAFWLQGVQGSSLASQAVYQQTEVVTVPGLRGDLLDRSGNKLAASEDAATIYATPYQVKNPPKAAAKLAPILEQPKGGGAGSADRRRRLLLRRPESRPCHRRQGRSARPGRDRRSCPTAAAPTRRARWPAR